MSSHMDCVAASGWSRTSNPGRLLNFTDADDGEAAAVLGADCLAGMTVLRRRYDPHGLAPGRTSYRA